MTKMPNNTNKVFVIILGIALLLLAGKIIYSYSVDYYSTDDDMALKGLLLAEPPTRKKQHLTNEEIENLNQEQTRIDLKYCGGPCRFINLLYVREQGNIRYILQLLEKNLNLNIDSDDEMMIETRAQLHVRQFAFTAGTLNRTVILPNVAGSRLGACLPYDYEYYYDMDWAKRNSDYFKYITMVDFKSWLEERKSAQVPVEDQVLSIYDVAEHNPPMSTQVLHCFSGYTKPRSSFNQVMSWDIRRKIAHHREEQLIDFLRGPAVNGSDNDLHDNDDLEVLQVEIHKA
jgi:hypothetical protein